MNVLFAQAANPQAKQQADQMAAIINEMTSGPLGIGTMLLGLVALGLFIWICVVMFQKGQTGLGIATLITGPCCGIGAFIALIMGWVKSAEWNIRPLMAIYTVVLLLYLGLYGYLIATTLSQLQQVVK